MPHRRSMVPSLLTRFTNIQNVETAIQHGHRIAKLETQVRKPYEKACNAGFQVIPFLQGGHYILPVALESPVLEVSAGERFTCAFLCLVVLCFALGFAPAVSAVVGTSGWLLYELAVGLVPGFVLRGEAPGTISGGIVSLSLFGLTFGAWPGVAPCDAPCEIASIGVAPIAANKDKRIIAFRIGFLLVFMAISM